MKQFLLFWLVWLFTLGGLIGSAIGLVWLFDHGHWAIALCICALVTSFAVAMAVWLET